MDLLDIAVIAGVVLAAIGVFYLVVRIAAACADRREDGSRAHKASRLISQGQHG